jgi:transmembrane sensor
MIRKKVMQRAIRSWTRRHSGAWHERDEAELQAWLAETAQHREAYEKVARAWDTVGELHSAVTSEAAESSNKPRGTCPTNDVRSEDDGSAAVGEHRSNTRPLLRERHLARRLALAACVALLVAAGTLPLWSGTLRSWIRSDLAVHLVTLKGGSKPFVLGDGTRVLLDGDSELIARIGHDGRRVVLVRGEAVFNVLHDASRPFEVTAGAGRIRDLGTRFDIETRADSIRIAVLEGQVAVLTAHGGTSLAAGQAGGYDEHGYMDPVSSLDRTVGPWLEGTRHFDHERLGDVLDRLARHHTVTFTYHDPHLRDLRFSGTFNTDNVDLFLRTLAAALPIEARYVAPNRIDIVSRSQPPSRDSRLDGRTVEPH